jgi:hypothetical protein
MGCAGGQYMEGPIFDILSKCIARIVLNNGNGTGFFVGPS